MSTTEVGEETGPGADERAIRHGFGTAALDAAALQRIHDSTLSEWRRATQSAQVRARPARVATAAALALVVLAAGSWRLAHGPMSAAPPPLGRLAQVQALGVQELHPLRADRVLRAGATLGEGQTIETLGAARVNLAGGGHLRIAAGTRFDVLSSHEIRLQAGRLYFDRTPLLRAAEPLVVETPAGSFQHLGTQFELSVHAGVTQLRVREGRVLWTAASGRRESGSIAVAAGNEMTLARDGSRAARPFRTSDAHWAWTESLAPQIEIEGRSLHDFLQQVARESGRKLEFADPATQRAARTIVLHGSIRGLSPRDSLQLVLASTALRFDLSNVVIRVSSAREARPRSN